MTRRVRTALQSDLRRALAAAGDRERAPGAQRYMKSAMPFYGVGAGPLRAICRELFARHALADAAAWRAAIHRIYFGARHREERYVAIELLEAPSYQGWLDLDALPLVEEMLIAGAWWDLVDAIATRPLGELLRRHPSAVRRRLLAWSQGEDLWLRRAAILAQLHFREATDRALLARLIAPSLGRREFFLAKGIGWALRQLARSDPEWVRDYVARRRELLAPLSVREATKHLRGV